MVSCPLCEYLSAREDAAGHMLRQPLRGWWWGVDLKVLKRLMEQPCLKYSVANVIVTMVTSVFPSPKLTSQHPYAEVYIGRPHVWTVNIDDPVEVEQAIRSILSQKVSAYSLALLLFLWVVVVLLSRKK